MATTGTESIPTSWNDERDTAFFGIIASLFSCAFTYGAGVLLASYDDEIDTVDTPAADPVVTPSSIPTSTGEHVRAR